MLPSSSRPPEPIEYLPVPTKSARVFTADGWHGPTPTTLQPITCASQLCQLNSVSRPSLRMCSHELPEGPPPSCSGLELPPNEFCLWPRLPVSGSSFMQPPPVSLQVPSGAHCVGSQASTDDASRRSTPPSGKQAEVYVASTVRLFCP